MAAPTNSFSTGSAVGIRESLHDKIEMLDKDEFPFQSSIGSGTANNTREEWQTDTLGSATTTNATLEGDDTTAASITATVRVANRTQILKKAFTINETTEAVEKAGRDSEIGYQTMLYSRRIKMDLEAILLLNQASNAEAGTTPRRMGGALAWLSSNVSRGTTGSSGGYSGSDVVAATNSSITRAFTETLLKPVIKSAWEAGGNPSVILVSAGQKQTMSAFTGIATQYQEAKGRVATIVGAADRYVSDFGTFTVVPDRFMSTRDALVYDPSMFRMLWLRKFKRVELAKTGDARKFHIIGEVTLKVNNEAAHGVVADLS
jgi:hypothetical protein